MAVKLPLGLFPTHEIETRIGPYSPMSPELHSRDLTITGLEDDGTAGAMYCFIFYSCFTV